MKPIKHLIFIPIALLTASAPSQKPANDVVFSAPFYTLGNAQFQKLWDQATRLHPTRVIGQISSQKKYSFVRGGIAYIWMTAPSPGYDFEGLTYRYTLYDKDQKQIGASSSVQVVGVRDWIKSRGRMPANMNLPLEWQVSGTVQYLQFEFVQDGYRFKTDLIRPF